MLTDNRINWTHKQALRLLYQNKNVSFTEPIELDNAVTIHQTIIQVLVTFHFISLTLFSAGLTNGYNKITNKYRLKQKI